MNEEDQQSSSSQPAPDDEEAKNFVNQPGYQKGAMGMVNLIVDVMNDTHEYKEAIFCKYLLMECSRKHHLDLEEQIERVVAHAQDIDEFGKYMKAKNGELNPKRISEQQFAYAIDQLKIPNCKSPGRLAGGFMGQMAGYGNHTVPSS